MIAKGLHRFSKRLRGLMIDLSHTFEMTGLMMLEMKGLVMLEMTGLRSLRNLSVGAQHNI